MKKVIALLSAAALSAACSALTKSESPTSPEVTTSTANATAGTVKWTSNTSDLPSGASCSNFTWTITSQTSTSLDGTFSLLCLGAVTVTGTAHGTLSNGTVVALTADGSASGQGVPAGCTFTLTANGTIQNSNALPLNFTAQTCMGPVTGRTTLRKSTPTEPAPAPEPVVEAPAPPPPTPPAPPPTPTSNDAIDLSQATVVLGPANIASWPQTSTVTGTTTVDHDLCIYHTKLGQWPTNIFFDDPNTLLEGNQWIVANIGGHWYAGAADWYRPGQACKDVTPATIGHDAFYNPSWEPLRSWEPRPGEQFGLFSSTPARMWPNMRTVDERSNVVLVTWQY